MTVFLKIMSIFICFSSHLLLFSNKLAIFSQHACSIFAYWFQLNAKMLAMHVYIVGKQVLSSRESVFLLV